MYLFIDTYSTFTQKSDDGVLDSLRASIRLQNQSIIAVRYMNPRLSRMSVMLGSTPDLLA
ncbi:MAG: hypothetical protein ACI38O_12840 [Fibrobacter intestinalis]|uniref:hypothetical protein n=1 Tax=Fibrobacter intestinalis TaxID=28122 RepID=UPI003F07A897